MRRRLTRVMVAIGVSGLAAACGDADKTSHDGAARSLDGAADSGGPDGHSDVERADSGAYDAATDLGRSDAGSEDRAGDADARAADAPAPDLMGDTPGPSVDVASDGLASDAPSAPAATIGCGTFIGSDALMDVGHGHEIRRVWRSGDRVLSADVTGHWKLWDLGTGLPLASGDIDIRTKYDGLLGGLIPDRLFPLEGLEFRSGILVARIAGDSQYEIRDASTGNRRCTVPYEDGSHAEPSWDGS